MNLIRNSIFISYLFIFFLVFSLIFSIGGEFYDGIIDNFPIDISMYENIYNLYPTVRDVFQSATNFLLVFLITITLMSSAIESGNIMSYFINFLGGLIVSSILLFLLSNVYTFFTLASVDTILNFDMMPTWFINNFQYILIINVIAGLCSFIFVRKEMT